MGKEQKMNYLIPNYAKSRWRWMTCNVLWVKPNIPRRTLRVATTNERFVSIFGKFCSWLNDGTVGKCSK